MSDDEARLKLQVLPLLSAQRVDSVTRRQIWELVERLRSDGRLAPKNVRNVYGTLRTLFRDAPIEELISIDPCVLPRHPAKPTRGVTVE